jgi:pilus assembly protein CpaB
MRNQRAILVLGLAVLLGLTAAFVAKRYLQGQQPAQVAAARVATVPVVIAKLDVSVGTPLDERALSTVQWPEDYVPKGAISSAEKIAGRVVRRALSHGEPVLDAYLLPEGSEAGLPAVIEAERRAVSVKVDPVIGVAGFVRPGSRVDVLATLRRIDQPKNLPYSKVILQDVPVLAIDQKLEEAKNGEPELVSVVTLEVKPDQAEKLIYSAHEGRLQLALRRPGDGEVVKTQAIGVADLLGGTKKKRVASTRHYSQVEVIKGSSRSVRSF